VRLADEAYYLGPPPPAQSHLSIPKLIELATAAKVDAIHPGLSVFDLINPCGLAGAAVTSIRAVAGSVPPREDAGRDLCRHFGEVYGLVLSIADLRGTPPTPEQTRRTLAEARGV